MSIEFAIVLFFLAFMVILSLGLPIAFSLISISLIFTAIFMGAKPLYVVFTSTYYVMTNEIYLAIPLFTFMAAILQFCGIASNLYEMMYKWSGPLRGGLAVGTVFICTILAAMTGLGGTGVVTTGLIAYPEMEKRHYDKMISIGVIPSASCLGPLIPPSIVMIVLGGYASLSIGKLFAGGVIPGLLMSGLFIGYILVRCAVNPIMAPALPKEELATWKEKFISLRALALPILIVVGVLGGIYSGAATPTEAAAIGVVGAALSAAVNRTLKWSSIVKAVQTSLKISVMVTWLLIGGTTFSFFLTGSGGGDYIVHQIAGTSMGSGTTVALMLLVSLILGCFIDGAAITMICVPIFFPIIRQLGVDPLWFGLVFSISIIIGYITPPFGANLFYMKGVLPRLNMRDIYASVIPFVGLQFLVLLICIVFPAVTLWLPSQMK